jgi:hypothetical protein
MMEGRLIHDIGFAPERKRPSPFYEVELEEIAGYPRVVRVPSGLF